jgi:hypothetical protein
MTAGFLRHLLGSLEDAQIALALQRVLADQAHVLEPGDSSSAVRAVPVVISSVTYQLLCERFIGVSDEHRMQLLITAIQKKG